MQVSDDATAEAPATTDLRGFHLRGAESAEPPVPGLLPLALARLRDPARVRTDWPLLLPIESGTGPVPPFVALPDALSVALERSGGGRVLRDNLARAERWLRQASHGRGEAVAAAPLLSEAGQAMRKELELAPQSDRDLDAEWRALVDALGPGMLLPFAETSALVLFARAAAADVSPAREAFRRDARELAARLTSLLEIERDKTRSREPGTLRESVGTAGSDLVDPAALAELLGPRRGTVRMEPERERRIREALAVLERIDGVAEAPVVMLVHDGSLDGAMSDEPGRRMLTSADPCGSAVEVARGEAARWTDVFRALRVARLEAAGRFDPLRHVPWMREFGPEAFSREERKLLPVVVAYDSADRVAGRGMASLSRLLRSGEPVHAILPVHAGRDPGAPGHEPLGGRRLELGYFGIGHRTAFVQQSSLSHPAHLTEGFRRAVAVPRPGLHVLSALGVAADGMPDGLRDGAAVEGRAHPFFRYDPEAGTTWAGRMDFSDNPQREEDWPLHDVDKAPGGPDGPRVPFTFADFALTDPALATEFRIVADDAPAAELAEVPAWLALSGEDALRRIPFVWAADAQGKVRRLAITRRLATACLERRDYWHTLQELAGIRNAYVREAVQRAMEETASHHADELAQAKRDAAALAMQALARRLLELDAGGGGWAAAPGAPASGAADGGTAPVEAAAGAPAAAATEARPTAGSEAPWIDAAMCTTCNECININPQMFRYNADKQATIADASKGTFLQLVKAAEKCPAKCIHPGDPVNPSEPNLDALKKRAAVFR